MNQLIALVINLLQRKFGLGIEENLPLIYILPMYFKELMRHSMSQWKGVVI